MENELKQIINERGNELDFYVLVYNKKTTEYLNDIIFQTYQEALEKFYVTNTENQDVVVELIFSPQKNDKKYCDNVIIMRKENTYTKEDLKFYGCNEDFIEKVWKLPTDALYEVVCDRQRGDFAMGIQLTIRDWVCKALEWLYYDEVEDVNEEWLLEDSIARIDDFWDITIEKVK